MNHPDAVFRRLRGTFNTSQRLRHLGRAILCATCLSTLLALGLGEPAQANPVRYTVSGVFDTGSLMGKRYLESFTFDDAGRPAVLGSTPWTTPLLDFHLEVESQTKVWSLADWPLEHFFSMWIDPAGFTNSRAYVSTPGPLGNPPAFAEFHDDGAPHSRTEHVKWYDWSVWNTRQTDSLDEDPLVFIAKVPEPVSIALVLLALLLVGGQGLARRRGRTRQGRDRDQTAHEPEGHGERRSA